jgi:hypothetical protein
MRPSASTATSTSWIWPRSWLAEIRCSAVLDPLHRAAQAQRRPRHEDLLRIEQHHLGAEAAAHVGRHDLHLEFGQAEDPREAVLDRQRRLRGRPHLQHAGARVVLGGDAAPFDRAPAAPLDHEALAQDVRDGGS